VYSYSGKKKIRSGFDMSDRTIPLSDGSLSPDLKTEINSSIRNVVLKYKQDILDKEETMDNVQKRNICTSLPSSQTLRSYLLFPFSAASRQALRSTYNLTQGIQFSFSPGLNRQGYEVDHLPPSVAEVENT
jgi:hypothetical protein